MDLTQIIGLSGFGGLVLLVGYFFAGNRNDRVDYRKALAELRTELAAERAANAAIEQQLDTERGLRRTAEDEKAEAKREVGALGYENAHLRAENARLHSQLGLP